MNAPVKLGVPRVSILRDRTLLQIDRYSGTSLHRSHAKMHFSRLSVAPTLLRWTATHGDAAEIDAGRSKNSSPQSQAKRCRCLPACLLIRRSPPTPNHSSFGLYQPARGRASCFYGARSFGLFRQVHSPARTYYVRTRRQKGTGTGRGDKNWAGGRNGAGRSY